MAELYDGLRSRLIEDAPTAAILATHAPATGPSTKAVFWGLRPQGSSVPAITLHLVSDPRPQHLKGLDGARGTRVQLDAWASTHSEASALAQAAIGALQPPADVAGKRFATSSIDGQRGATEATAAGLILHRQSVDLLVWHVGN